MKKCKEKKRRRETFFFFFLFPIFPSQTFIRIRGGKGNRKFFLPSSSPIFLPFHFHICSLSHSFLRTKKSSCYIGKDKSRRVAANLLFFSISFSFPPPPPVKKRDTIVLDMWRKSDIEGISDRGERVWFPGYIQKTLFLSRFAIPSTIFLLSCPRRHNPV